MSETAGALLAGQVFLLAGKYPQTMPKNHVASVIKKNGGKTMKALHAPRKNGETAYLLYYKEPSKKQIDMKGHRDAALNGAIVRTFAELEKKFSDYGIEFDPYIQSAEFPQQKSAVVPAASATVQQNDERSFVTENGDRLGLKGLEMKEIEKLKRSESVKDDEKLSKEERKRRKAARKAHREEKRRKKEAKRAHKENESGSGVKRAREEAGEGDKPVSKKARTERIHAGSIHHPPVFSPLEKNRKTRRSGPRPSFAVYFDAEVAPEFTADVH